jgi:hypothetical protein
MPRMDNATPATAEEAVSEALVAPPSHQDGGSARKFIEAVEKVAPLGRVGPARQIEVFVAAFEMAQRLARAPFDVSRGLVQSAVVVDVDVDVDIASRQAPPPRVGEQGQNAT